MSDRWAAVIPAYNAAKAISGVIVRLSNYLPLNQILVVDDGSIDETAIISEVTGVRVLQKPSNSGKGAAIRSGFAYIADWNVDWVICMDADGQHDPDAFPAFQQTAANGQFDLIIGSRRNNLAGMPGIRRFSNVTSSALLSLWTGQKMPDVQCGYRAIRVSVLQQLNLMSKSYEIETEMLLKAARLKLRIGFVPVPTIYQGEVSYLRKIPETWRFLRLLLTKNHED